MKQNESFYFGLMSCPKHAFHPRFPVLLPVTLLFSGFGRTIGAILENRYSMFVIRYSLFDIRYSLFQVPSIE